MPVFSMISKNEERTLLSESTIKIIIKIDPASVKINENSGLICFNMIEPITVIKPTPIILKISNFYLLKKH